MLNLLIKVSLSYLVFLSLISCNSESDLPVNIGEKNSPLFALLSKEQTGIKFKNVINDTREFNYLFYQYMYNGGGVGAGDFNNDGLIDLYFSGNQVANKLYLNKGDFQFEDITKNANVACSGQWSNGVSIVDINGDGWLDIYVCVSASLSDDEPRKNRFFINNQDNTFSDKAEQLGLADSAYSNQAYFLDYDQDGDLDMYLLNHRIDFSDNLKTDEAVESNFSSLHSDKLYRNDAGKFKEVTVEAGLLNHAWGLSCSVGDFNNDGWQDIYVCNDFVQPDYLYINQKDGTFKDEISDRMSHTSFYSMGSDFEDINNDALPDLFVADMVSQSHERSIRNMAAMDADEFDRLDQIGYGKQYMFNMLQLNQGNGEYAEIAQLAGLSKTDWSWAPLIADYDNDGKKDLFVTNGIKRDVTDIDYKEQVRMRAVKGNPMGPDEVFNSWPSTQLENYVFKNLGDFKFKDVSRDWGLNKAQNSNGAIYADLDIDGDLDLVMSNMDSYPSVYQNNTEGNFCKIKLNGPEGNINGIGAQIILQSFKHGQIAQLNQPSKGFLSSSLGPINFGIPKSIGHFDLVHIYWPNGHYQVYKGIDPGTELEVNYFEPKKNERRLIISSEYFKEKISGDFGIDHIVEESNFDDFKEEVLLPQKQSTYGGCTCVADFNGDGLEDLFSGNALGKSPSIHLQNEKGLFNKSQKTFWKTQAEFEDQSCLALDIDKDGDQDLIVGSATYENPSAKDRIYLNNGKGEFVSGQLIDFLSNTSCIAYDGEELIFIGGRTLPGKYPLKSPAAFFSLENGRLEFKSSLSMNDEFQIVNDAIFTDYDNDGDKDLIVVGEWMPITIVKNDDGKFERIETIRNSSGWWNCIKEIDQDGNGSLEYVIGNLGENNKYKPSVKEPFHIYSNDFDENGSLDIVLTKQKGQDLLPARGRECSAEQIPSIKRDFPTYTAFGKADINKIYGADKIDESLHLQVETFSTSILKFEEGNWKLKRLPSLAQFGPTMAFEIVDVNEDGISDIIGCGNLWDAEAETIRYDANRGYVLINDGEGSFTSQLKPSYEIKKSGFYYNNNARDIDIIVISNKKHLVLTSNNDQLRLFEIK